MRRTLFGPAAALALVGLSLGVTTLLGAVAAPAAHADSAVAPVPGVSSSCSTLTVKPKGFADKGEVRIVVDGEVQTDGTTQRDASGDDWRVFKGSFPGVYAFDPRVAHTWSVDVNSFGSDSGGRSFDPGTGADAQLTGTTTPCSPVSLATAATNCTSPGSVAKQGLDLSVGDLRRSTTYLIEVLSEGRVVTHFQFRTQPEITKHFSGLIAGTTYTVRVTDQSDSELSTSREITIPGCAAAVGLTAAVPSCASDGQTSSVVADLDSLVIGRGYDVALTSSDTGQVLPVVSILGDDAPHRVTFDSLAQGTYRVSVSDTAAPRTARSGALVVGSCESAAASPAPVGTPGASAPAPAAGSASATSSPSGGASAAFASSSGRGGPERATSVVTVSVDGSPVSVAAPGSERKPAPGEPTAVSAAGAATPAASPILPWLVGGVVTAGVGSSAVWLWRRRVAAA